MITTPLHPETVTVVIAGVAGQDDWGNDVLVETERVIEGCAVYPRPISDPERDAQVVAGLTVLAPWGTEVDPHAKVRARGQVWDVLGEPMHWRSALTGSAGAVEIALSKTKG